MSEEVKEKVSPDPADPTVKVTDFDLIEIADLADQAKTLMFDVLEDFFEKYNPNEPADIKWIEWGFRCQRTKCRTVANLLWQIDKQLKEWGITV